MAESNSHDSWLNFQLICKPEQSGKTFVMIKHIINDLTLPVGGKEIVNFILCDNNLLLAKQTSMRVDTDLCEYIHEGHAYIELSSHERTEFHCTSDVFQAIVAKGSRNVICCTNERRMDDIYQLIKDINANKFTLGKFHFNVWLDEADKFIKFIDNTLRPIVKEHQNVNVKLITATPHSLFQKYKYMNVLPIENTTSLLYHGWNDNTIRIIENENLNKCLAVAEHKCLVFAEHVLNDVAQSNIIPGTKWFIPGASVKKSHNEIKTLCLEKGMAVLCVNGDGLKLTMPDTRECVSFNKDCEFSHKIQEIYCEYNLSRFALVITGYICIGRGITIMSEDFMIDYAILSHHANKNEVSQIAGRVKGNIKGFKNYNPETPPVIFTTESFNKTAVEWESKSRSLGSLAFEKEQNGELTIIDKCDFKACNKPYKYKCHEELFTSFAQAKDFLSGKAREMTKPGEKMRKIKETKGEVIHQCEGYFVTSKLLKVGESVKDLTKDCRVTLQQAKDIQTGRCISATGKGSRYLILPVYDNELSPPESVKYQARYITFTCD